jgi:hypothetical protein
MSEQATPENVISETEQAKTTPKVEVFCGLDEDAVVLQTKDRVKLRVSTSVLESSRSV